jgi:cation:H+ antiporter
VAYVFLLIGLVLLVVGAEMLVRGGGQLALALRVPALVVGLTIVAFGTSAPELLVSVTAAMNASTEMALGNVNGSNLANIALVLGLAAMVNPLVVERTLMRRDVPSCLALQLMVPALCYDGILSRGDGFILLGGGVVYNVWLLYEALRGRAPVLDDELDLDDDSSPAKHFAMLLVGIVVLVGGAVLFVDGAEGVAKAFELSDRFIGLTVVALGTSAPEIATAVASARRGDTDLAVGNSLGSNLLNIAMVLGLTSIISPIVIHDTGAFRDMAAAVVVTALLIPFVLKGRVTRLEGGLMAAAYLGYMFGPLVL